MEHLPASKKVGTLVCCEVEPAYVQNPEERPELAVRRFAACGGRPSRPYDTQEDRESAPLVIVHRRPVQGFARGQPRKRSQTLRRASNERLLVWSAAMTRRSRSTSTGR
jgi:hypothetical protein